MDKINLTFLGTGDSMPSEKRNHPGFLLSYKEDNILVDCGEGIQRQFRIAGLNPCKVTKILITHWHGDHVFGLPGFLETLSSSEYRKVLEIYGPKGIKENLKNMFNTFNQRFNFEIKIEEVSKKFFENEDFYLEAEAMSHGTPCNSYNFVVKDQRRIDKKKLEKLKLPFGKHLQDLKNGKDISIERKKYKSKDLTYLEKGRKISFVLDTLFNPKIIPFVKDADILVSESTFDSGMEEKAKEHKHMTVDQVANYAKKAKVKKLYLVHLSQRYSKNLKDLLDNSKKIFKESYLAKDFDSIEIR